MFVRLATTLLIPLLLSSTAITLAQTPPSTAIAACLERLKEDLSFRSSHVWATYQERNTTYYLVNLFPQTSESEVRDGIFSTDSAGCQALEVYPSGNSIPVTGTIPQSVARGLTLAVVQAEMAEVGEIQAYQDYLNRSAQDTGVLYLDQNKVWALQQIGVQLDPSIEVLSPPAAD